MCKFNYFIFLVINLILTEAKDQCLKDDKNCNSANHVKLGNLDFEVLGTEIKLTVQNENGEVGLEGFLGKSLPEILGIPNNCQEEDFCLEWGSAAKFTVAKTGDFCYDLRWTTNILQKFQDCFSLGSQNNVYWFGGPEEYYQRFPMNPEATRESVPYLPGDMLQDKDHYFGGVAEPYWLNSKGIALWVPEGIPLHYSWNAHDTSDQMCFEAKNTPPYEQDLNVILAYKICSKDNPKTMHMYAINDFLGKPIGIPDEKMIRDPIWSSWAQYKANINQSTILNFAQTIHDYGFKVSQIEIDDNWENCYGDAEFDQTDNKFPDAKGMIKTIKDVLGFRVTLWIHPFVNLECSSWKNSIIPPIFQPYVKDKKGQKGIGNLPGLVYWWQGFMASIIDFTNPEAVQWWKGRLENLRTNYGIDSFKFDAGESNWLPSSLILNSSIPKSMWPAAFTSAYVDTVSTFGSMIEVRVGRRTQNYPIFVRMLDKDSHWGFDNGIKTLVTTLLQMSMVGYPFVLPDMIGGNGYGDDPLDESTIPSKEMYVRWLQANVFMPGMQFSFVPWLYDQDVINHTKDMISLREKYADLMVQLFQQTVETGEPVNRPIWWLDPYDEISFGIEDEFLLGNDLLVAPVLEEGVTMRKIYLPKGNWAYRGNLNDLYSGPAFYEYPVDIYTLPYFTLVE